MEEEKKDNKTENAEVFDDLVLVTAEIFRNFASAEICGQTPIKCSRKHKIHMNRILRENTNGRFLPFPEVDTPFEKTRNHMLMRITRMKKRFKRKH